MPKSISVCNKILALIYNATAWANVADNAAAAPITLVHIALKTASDTPSSTMSTGETAYTNYVRQSIARTTGGWTTPSGGATSNVAVLNYPQCGVTGATIVGASSGLVGAGDVFHYGNLNSSIAVSNLIRPTFDPGAITITEG